MAIRLVEDAWPRPKIVLCVLPRGVEYLGAEITEEECKSIYQYLYYKKGSDEQLVQKMGNVYRTYLAELRLWLIQRTFGLFVRVPWSMMKTLSRTNTLRREELGGEHDGARLQGLWSKPYKTGRILPTDAVFVPLGREKEGLCGDKAHGVAVRKRVRKRGGAG